jgi:hypothetical protein
VNSKALVRRRNWDLFFPLVIVFLIAMLMRIVIVEIVVVYWWHGVILGALSLVMLTWMLSASGAVWWLMATTFLIALAMSYGIPWGIREQFIRDLYAISPGMSQSDVRYAMRAYLRGPKFPVESTTPEKSTAAGDRSIASSDCDMFRHADIGPDEFDTGVICYLNGTVYSVSFSSD